MFVEHDFSARPHPDPLAHAITQAEGVVDGVRAGGGDGLSDRVEVAILRMDQFVHVAAGEVIIARLHAEDFIHGGRPVDAATRQVPIPEAAVAAAESLRHAVAQGLESDFGFAGRRSLPGIAASGQNQDRSGEEQQQVGAHHCGAPVQKHPMHRMNDCNLSQGITQVPNGAQRLAIVQHDAQGASLFGEGGERLARS